MKTLIYHPAALAEFYDGKDNVSVLIRDLKGNRYRIQVS